MTRFLICSPCGATVANIHTTYQAAFNYRAANNLVGHRIIERSGFEGVGNSALLALYRGGDQLAGKELFRRQSVQS